MEQLMVPQIDATNPNPTPDAAAMALTGDTMRDLQNVAKELGVSVDGNGIVVEAPAQPAPVAAQPPKPSPAPVEAAPAQPQAAEQPAAQPVEVPEKFQNADGTPNVEKIVKSTISAEEAISRYKAKERELSQVQNRVNNPAPQAVQGQPAGPQPLTNLEVAMANDLINEAAAQGLQMDQRFAIAQAKVMARGLEAKHGAEVSVTQELRQRVEDQQRTIELKDMVAKDPSLLSADMVEALWRVRQENPWINQAPEPWKAALHYYRGSQGHAPQVQTPTPTGTAAKAPPTPVGPVARVQKTVDISNPKSLNDAQLLEEIRKVYPRFRNL